MARRMHSLILEAIVTAVISAVVVKSASVASTKDVLDEPFDFAFLDVDGYEWKNLRDRANPREEAGPVCFRIRVSASRFAAGDSSCAFHSQALPRASNIIGAEDY